VNAPRLAPVLGFREGFAMLVGLTIGVGILRTPGIIAGYLPSPWLILGAWILGGVMVALSTLVFAELAGQLPQAGGKYVYARAAFGDTAGFVVGAGEFLGLRAFTASAKAVVIGVYLASLVGGDPRLLTGIAVCCYLPLHLRGLRTTAMVQNWASLLKGLFLLAVVGICVWYGRGTSWDEPLHPATGTVTWLAFALAYQAIWYTYYGWEDIVKMTEELRDHARVMPQILLGGSTAIGVLYLALNAGFLHVLTPAQMAGSDFVARDALKAALGAGAGTLLTIGGLVLLLGSINVNFISNPRIAFGLARDGLAPQAFLKLDARGTPRTGLLVTIGLVLVLSTTGTVEWLIRFMTFVSLLVDGIVILALFRLRRTAPDAPRPFRIPWYPWLPLIVLMMYGGILTMVIVTQPQLALGGVGVLAAIFAATLWRQRVAATTHPVQPLPP
jgi:basic amino acid/polyamine antiporter, APA family